MIWCASICRYNTVMKLVFLGTSTSIIYYMRYHRIIKLTYDKEQDTFKHVLLIAPSAVLALLTTHNYTILEVCRSNSIGSHTNACLVCLCSDAAYESAAHFRGLL